MDPAAEPGFGQDPGDAVDDLVGGIADRAAVFFVLGGVDRAGLAAHCSLLPCLRLPLALTDHSIRIIGQTPVRTYRNWLRVTVIWIAVEIIPPRVKEPLYRLYELRLRQGLAASKSALPRHIAVLCDGNRRWARDAGYDDVSYGYRMGAAKIAEMLRWCQEAGIEMATVYLLSTENLRRDPAELAALIEIITDVVEEICAPANRWSVRTVGDLELIGEEPARRLRDAVESTAATANAGFHVNVAVGYGGRQEIAGAVRALLSKEIANGAGAEELVDAVTVDAISENLYTSGQPDPDLVIRTSGEQRLSGFLLWQSAYSEMWFTEAHWPAFRRVDFLRALRDYSLRHRRYGICRRATLQAWLLWRRLCFRGVGVWGCICWPATGASRCSRSRRS